MCLVFDIPTKRARAAREQVNDIIFKIRNRINLLKGKANDENL